MSGHVTLLRDYSVLDMTCDPEPEKVLRGSHKGPFTQAIFVARLNAIFVALKLQLQYRTCKPAAISARF